MKQENLSGDVNELDRFGQVFKGNFNRDDCYDRKVLRLLIPSVTAIYLTDLGEARGRQELYTRQSPQKLKTLKEHALIESAVSSNRKNSLPSVSR